MDVGRARVKKAVEALDEADDFDPELIGTSHRAMDGCIESRRIAARRENPDSFHEYPPLLKAKGTELRADVALLEPWAIWLIMVLDPTIPVLCESVRIGVLQGILGFQRFSSLAELRPPPISSPLTTSYPLNSVTRCAF